MELTKEYLYNRDKIVLLVCDFYETSQIPPSIFDIKDNLALFPIVNVPLIDYILNNLLDQHFKNVIISGRQIDSVISYLETTKYKETMNIRCFRCEGNSLGDIFRSIDDNGFEFKELIVMYANHYTNISLGKLLKKHKKSKNTIMTLFVHETQSNDTSTHLYALQNGIVLYYEKTNNNKVSVSDIIGISKNNKHIEVCTLYSGPTMAVVSGSIFPLFTENFDFTNLGDFMIGILAAGIYNYKMYLLTEDELAKINGDRGVATEYSTQYYSIDPSYSGAIYTETVYCSEEPENYYSFEINTLFDYYKMNSDVAKKTFSIFKLQKQPDFIKGNIKHEKEISNSFVGESSSIEGNLKNCIVWENCHVCGDYEGYILCNNGKTYNFCYLESFTPLSAGEEDEFNPENIKNETFFNDFNSYLNSCIYSPKFSNLDLNDVFQQISLLRIVWNASKTEVVEAFSYFFIDSIDFSYLEDSISKCSIFFGILAEFIKTKDDQEFLMSVIYDHLIEHELTDGVRAQIFFSFAYLFVENSIIDKSVVKKYNKMHKVGKF